MKLARRCARREVLTAGLVATVGRTGAAAGHARPPRHVRPSPARAPRRSTSPRPGDESPLDLVAVTAYPAMGTSSYEKRVLARINAVRSQHGLRGLAVAPCASTVANHWSAHLAATDTFTHQSMSGLLRRCHANYAGETLGRATVSPKTLVKHVDALRAAPPHPAEPHPAPDRRRRHPEPPGRVGRDRELHAVLTGLPRAVLRGAVYQVMPRNWRFPWEVPHGKRQFSCITW